jgi:hypothetical protein
LGFDSWGGLFLIPRCHSSILTLSYMRMAVPVAVPAAVPVANRPMAVPVMNRPVETQKEKLAAFMLMRELVKQGRLHPLDMIGGGEEDAESEEVTSESDEDVEMLSVEEDGDVERAPVAEMVEEDGECFVSWTDVCC